MIPTRHWIIPEQPRPFTADRGAMIIAILEDCPAGVSLDYIVKEFGMSRTATAKVVNQLIAQKRVEKDYRNVVYTSGGRVLRTSKTVYKVKA